MISPKYNDRPFKDVWGGFQIKKKIFEEVIHVREDKIIVLNRLVEPCKGKEWGCGWETMDEVPGHAYTKLWDGL